MKKYTMTSIGLLLCSGLAYAQKIEIEPYLQNASPNAMTIMWQTDFGEEATVLWGTDPKLGKVTQGTSSDINFTQKRLHKVILEGLERFTNYHYQVKTGEVTSKVYQFKTPPFPKSTQKFNIVAMSDMQIDRSHPDKFREVVEEGILAYFEKSAKSISEAVAMVLTPGDLVENGTKFAQWQHDFFTPGQKLFAKVPLYPVPGNHERNSNYFFKYFSLPKNGSPEYAEHWWYKDYANTRIIGLDSNPGYRDFREQLAWLKKILDETANDSAVDFVFAQLHHPHKSELWIPGEIDFTGKVIELLEAFSTKTGKPSLHFFGHTHGYSRGQSKSHKHLWVNVASAGGAIDNWGEFEGKDYDEFTVTQDEYGFVVATVNPSKENPSFTLKRISRGNNLKPRDNEQTDSITVYKNTEKPHKPVLISPVNTTEKIVGVMLKAGAFQSEKPQAFHAASHWQVATSADFKAPVYDSWKQHENWYYKENRQKDDDLTDESVKRLKSGTTYFVRVRYRDQHLNWSDWSTVESFRTEEKVN